jgi:hypothetical protein
VAGFSNLAAETVGDFLNLSARGYSGADGPLILGFVTESAQPSVFLLRGVGPGLAQFSVASALSETSLVLRNHLGETVADNAAWARSANAVEIASTSSRVGAFPLEAESKDSAVLTALSSGAYTVVVGANANGTGAALAEIYGASVPLAPGTLKNVSIRGRVSGDEQPLIAGLVVAAGGARTVLIRGVGPSLEKFAVESPLSSPRLRLFNGLGQLVAEGSPLNGSSNAAEIQAVTGTVGAFQLKTDASDPALLVSLVPGSYTIHVTGLLGSSGNALAEIYAVP